MKSIGLIAAMAQEIRPLLRRAGRVERLPLGAFEGYRFRIADLDCLLVGTGVGERRAAAATQALLAASAPTVLISFGIAGAVDGDLRIGDVVAGERVYALEHGSPARPIDLAALSPGARQAAGRALALRRAGLVTGTIVTTPGAQTIRERPAGFQHPVLEMETAGIAHLAAGQGVPLLALRAISDNPAEPIPIPVEEIYDRQYRQRTAWLIWTILRRPALIPRLGRMARNAARAEENAALTVMAILGHMAEEAQPGADPSTCGPG